MIRYTKKQQNRDYQYYHLQGVSHHRVAGEFINAMKMTLDFNFDLNQAVKQHIHINIEIKRSYQFIKILIKVPLY